MFPSGIGRGATAGRSLLGVAGCDESRSALARTATSEPGAQAARACLPPLHRGLRRRGSGRRKSSADVNALRLVRVFVPAGIVIKSLEARGYNPAACPGYLKFLRRSNLADTRSSAIVASCWP